MGDTPKALMLKLFSGFMRPIRVERYMGGISSDGKCRSNVALKTVANHKKLVRINGKLRT